ncbi:MAG TPA: fibronectin type III domain-containing protein [Candidatus Onthocola stercorigallinarum]|nr:fibronectin type III domain-containing protein [Candidatus Onthocola stercorigallinarum]
MKKKVLIGVSGIFVIILGICICFYISKDNSDNEMYTSNIEDEKENSVGGFLTLMLETEAGSGVYEKSISSTWPGEGYVFNKELSSCQNGGELDYDSENNKVILYSNKSDGCYVYFDIYNKPTINSINLGEVTNNSITITVSATNGTNEISNYYYVINDGTPVSSTSNTYMFSGLSAGETYTIKVYVVDTEGYSSDTSSLNVETENAILLADWVISQYGGVQGNNGIYYHTSSLANSASDNSYRYSGTNPNNYVCFGSDESTCPEDNSYRIIGVFGSEAKLIKTDFANSNLLGTNGTYTSNTYNTSSYGNYNGNYSMVNRYEWNASNTWSSSRLNTVNLNDNLLNSFSTTWSDKITNHTWYVEGNSTYNTLPATWYEYESTGRTYSAKIGLMYVSDYAFSASPSYWTTNMNSYDDAISNNWMYMGISEWTISPVSSGSNLVAFVSDLGGISYVGVFYNSSYAVRPCFYLTSSTQYVSGSGTESDPIRIVV